MPISGFPIYLSTLLLEKNRANGKGPSLLVSDWMEPVGEAGFAGLEIWTNNLLLASRSEWDLIKEKSLEADLALALVSPNLPADASDKSRRLREAILEACEYFRPEGIKFTPSSNPRTQAEPGATRDALEFFKDWAKDIPRDVRLVYDGGEGSGLAGLLEARKILTGGRFQAVLHPFLLSPQLLGEALDALGDFVGNLGALAKRGDQLILLGENKDEHFKVIAMTRKKTYKGTWSVESTKGMGMPGENIDKMFDNAEKDLNFLIEALSRSAER